VYAYTERKSMVYYRITPASKRILSITVQKGDYGSVCVSKNIILFMESLPIIAFSVLVTNVNGAGGLEGEMLSMLS
jgi:hypothetical protein